MSKTRLSGTAVAGWSWTARSAAEFGPCNSFIRVGRHAATEVFGPVLSQEPFDGEIDNVFVFRETLSMRELESIRKYHTRAILALAKGEPLPEEGGSAGRK